VAGLAALAVLMAGYHFTLPLAASELAGVCVLAALLRAALTLNQLRALPEARREARTDPLTDLANRRHLHERCAHLLARPEAAPVTVLMIDLNGFKKVNDRHGHRVGDALLVQVATRLAAVLRREDLLGRLGGDEFAALLPATTTHQAHRIARRMHAVLAEPITVDAHTYSIGASIGISSINPPGSPPAALFHNADIAMYHAKTSRTGTAIAYRIGEPPTFRTPDPIRSGPEWRLIIARTSSQVQSGIQGRGREDGDRVVPGDRGSGSRDPGQRGHPRELGEQVSDRARR
jgi:diguanylate cyclase (GGDEF)-like protein